MVQALAGPIAPGLGLAPVTPDANWGPAGPIHYNVGSAEVCPPTKKKWFLPKLFTYPLLCHINFVHNKSNNPV
jgi:hypothetical protein